MPELPEAETIVRGLRPAVVDARIAAVRVPHPDVLRRPARTFSKQVRGRRIDAVERRGKNVLLRLDDGVIAVNLGMTGRLLPFPSPPRGGARPTHPAVWWRFEDGAVLYFDDVRRFGTVEWLDDGAWAERSGRMGPEPLSRGFTEKRMREGLAASRSPVRSWLLDQRRIAGVGNIYANEALFLAGIDPRTRACDVDAARADRLHAAIRLVLRNAIRSRGTTLRDYRDASGQEGQFASRLHVYGRDGEPCTACGRPIERIVFGGRSAFRCVSCQPEPGGA